MLYSLKNSHNEGDPRAQHPAWRISGMYERFSQQFLDFLYDFEIAFECSFLYLIPHFKYIIFFAFQLVPW